MKIYNAGKLRGHLVLTSFGTFRSILPFLSEKEVLGLQSCGKFFYDIAISRVQLKLCLPAELYFVQGELEKL